MAVAIVFLDRNISCLCASSDALVLAAGCHGGLIKTWTLSVHLNSFTKRSFRRYHGHTGNIICIHVSTEADILASGAYDGTTKVWCLSFGHLLRSLSAASYVGQVTVYPCVGNVNFATLFQEKHSLLVVDDIDICVYSWLRHDSNWYKNRGTMKEDAVVFHK
jgi:WD40 repeat protein